jgi:hypothetical protein
MQIDDKRFQDLESKVNKIYDWAIGDDLHPNGVEKRLKKNESQITKMWVTLYGIIAGLAGAIIFLLKYGEQLFS